jgi:hypothetical protein
MTLCCYQCLGIACRVHFRSPGRQWDLPKRRLTYYQPTRRHISDKCELHQQRAAPSPPHRRHNKVVHRNYLHLAVGSSVCSPQAQLHDDSASILDGAHTFLITTLSRLDLNHPRIKRPGCKSQFQLVG